MAVTFPGDSHETPHPLKPNISLIMTMTVHLTHNVCSVNLTQGNNQSSRNISESCRLIVLALYTFQTIACIKEGLGATHPSYPHTQTIMLALHISSGGHQFQIPHPHT